MELTQGYVKEQDAAPTENLDLMFSIHLIVCTKFLMIMIMISMLAMTCMIIIKSAWSWYDKQENTIGNCSQTKFEIKTYHL